MPPPQGALARELLEVAPASASAPAPNDEVGSAAPAPPRDCRGCGRLAAAIRDCVLRPARVLQWARDAANYVGAADWYSDLLDQYYDECEWE